MFFFVKKKCFQENALMKYPKFYSFHGSFECIRPLLPLYFSSYLLPISQYPPDPWIDKPTDKHHAKNDQIVMWEAQLVKIRQNRKEDMDILELHILEKDYVDMVLLQNWVKYY